MQFLRSIAPLFKMHISPYLLTSFVWLVWSCCCLLPHQNSILFAEQVVATLKF